MASNITLVAVGVAVIFILWKYDSIPNVFLSAGTIGKSQQSKFGHTGEVSR
jgi:hypothetical protein